MVCWLSAKDIGNLYMEHLVGYLKKWLNVQVVEDMRVQCLLNTALYLSDWQKEVDIEWEKGQNWSGRLPFWQPILKSTFSNLPMTHHQFSFKGCWFLSPWYLVQSRNYWGVDFSGEGMSKECWMEATEFDAITARRGWPSTWLELTKSLVSRTR